MKKIMLLRNKAGAQRDLERAERERLSRYWEKQRILRERLLVLRNDLGHSEIYQVLIMAPQVLKESQWQNEGRRGY